MKNYLIPLVTVLILLSFANCSEELIPPDPAKTINKIIVSPGNLVAPIDSTIQFTAYSIYQNNDTLQINAEWFSDDTIAVTINSSGLALCKNVGDAYIHAIYKDISSVGGGHLGARIDVIPKRKIISQFLIGQTQGIDVEYVDIVPDLMVPTFADKVLFNFDNDYKDDFLFTEHNSFANNNDIFVIIRGFGPNWVAISSEYQSIADSILYSQIDSNDTYNLPWQMEYFANWVDTLEEGFNFINYQDWHNGVGTMNYRYKRDASAYSSPNYGLFHDGEEKYVGMLFYNQYNYPIYCWFKVQFDGLNIFLKEYAFAPKYEIFE